MGRHSKIGVVAKFIYGEQNIIDRFGSLDVTYAEIDDYCAKLYATWGDRQLIVPYTKENLQIILREKRRVGSFHLTFSIQESTIIIRAQDEVDLTYLQLKYKFEAAKN